MPNDANVKRAKPRLPNGRPITARSTIALMILLPLIGGCATAPFDKRACPVESTYTKAEQVALADALRSAAPVIRSAFVDYGKLRDKARACRGK